MRARLLLAGLRRRPRQPIAVALAIAVGAGSVTAATDLAARARAAVAGDLGAFGPNLLVRPAVGGPPLLPASALALVHAVPGVLLAAGTLRLPRGSAEAIGPEIPADSPATARRTERPCAESVFVSPDYFRIHPAFAVSGRAPSAGEALLGAECREAGAVSFRSGGGFTARVVGRVTTGSELDRAAVLALADSRAAGAPDGLDAIEVRADGARLESVRGAIEGAVAGADVETLLRVSASERAFAGRVGMLLAVIAAIAFALALVAVAASTSAIVGERRRELALLSALGMTPRRVLAVLAREIAVVALAGAVAGALAGDAAAARLASRLLGGASEGAGAAGAVAAVLAAGIAALVALVAAAKRLERISPSRLLAGD